MANEPRGPMAPPVRQERGTKEFTLGDVGPKGQAFKGKVYKTGDKIQMTPAEVKAHREHGVPLIADKEDDDKPQDAA